MNKRGSEARSPRVITVLGFKGGAGRTPLAFNIASALRVRGARVLLVDCTADGLLSQIVLGGGERPGIGAALSRRGDLGRYMYTGANGMAIMPSDCLVPDLDWTTQDGEPAEVAKLWEAWRRTVGTVEGYDAVIVDTPRAITTLFAVAIQASTHFILTTRADPWAAATVERSLEAIACYRCAGIITALVPSLAQRSTRLDRQICALLQSTCGNVPMLPIRHSVSMTMALDAGQPVPRSAAWVYGTLADMLWR